MACQSVCNIWWICGGCFNKENNKSNYVLFYSEYIPVLNEVCRSSETSYTKFLLIRQWQGKEVPFNRMADLELNIDNILKETPEVMNV